MCPTANRRNSPSNRNNAAFCVPHRRVALARIVSKTGCKSAGELAEYFPVSKPTMSAHFAVLQEAGLIEAEKTGRTIVYRLVMSVLEEALLGFAQTFGWGPDSERTSRVAAGKLSKRRAKGEA